MNSSKIAVDKDEYLINSIAMGIAIQHLVSFTSLSTQQWVDRLFDEALRKCKSLTEEARDELVRELEERKSERT